MDAVHSLVGTRFAQAVAMLLTNSNATMEQAKHATHTNTGVYVYMEQQRSDTCCCRHFIMLRAAVYASCALDRVKYRI